MSAAVLGRVFRTSDCRVTVVAPAEANGSGVGEATIPSIVQLLQRLQADEANMMRACDATWKLAIQFRDWVEPGFDNWHPFGVCGARVDDRDLFHTWFADTTRSGRQQPYHDYSLHLAAARAGKSPHSPIAASPIAATRSYAFHLDANAFARWLRSRAVADGVFEHTGRVIAADRNKSGDVTAVRLQSGETVDGDLFVDCSGFEPVLLNRVYDARHVDWSSHLLCDRAVAVRMPGSHEIPPLHAIAGHAGRVDVAHSADESHGVRLRL